MSVAYFIFALIAAPLLFFMLTWVVVTAYRILFPEKPLPFEKDPIILRRKAAAAGNEVLVGVREIREDQKHHRSDQALSASYHYAFGDSDGVPTAWIEELWERRN